MRENAFLFMLIILWNQGFICCVRILELRVPGHAAEGDKILLGCQYNMEGEVLYAVKWYKDNREFFRYVPKSKRQLIDFSTPGVTVDLERSSGDEVALLDLSQQSAGTYRCEVSGEAPTFTTASEQKHVNIHYLPEGEPKLTGLQEKYDIGDHLLVNCSSSGSKPETKLKWLLNEKPVPRQYLQGPWYRTSVERADATETILQLRFTVAPRHFKDGIMKLRCHATIAPLYQKEAVHSAVWMETPTPPPTIAPSVIKNNLIHSYEELKHTGHLELPLTTDIPEQTDKDHAAVIQYSSWMLWSAILLFLV